MSTTDLAVPAASVAPDQITDSSGATFQRVDDPHAANRAALSPCPVCGANAHEGPEGEHWVQFPHCWRCGFNHTTTDASKATVAAVPMLTPGVIDALAASLFERIKSQMGLAPGETVVGPVTTPAEPVAARSTPTDPAGVQGAAPVVSPTNPA